MTGSMSRLIGCVTLAIGGTVTAAIWCLGLAVQRNICRFQTNDETWDGIGAVTHLSHFVVLFHRSMSCLCHPRLCAAHIPCCSCAPDDEERPLLGWLPVMLHGSVRANQIVYFPGPCAGARPSRVSIRAHSSRTTPQSHLVSFLLDPSRYIRERSPPPSPRSFS